MRIVRLGDGEPELAVVAAIHGDPPHDHCMLDRELTLVEFAPPVEE